VSYKMTCCVVLISSTQRLLAIAEHKLNGQVRLMSSLL
jgi:hypothetical protein